MIRFVADVDGPVDAEEIDPYCFDDTTADDRLLWAHAMNGNAHRRCRTCGQTHCVTLHEDDDEEACDG